MKRIVFGVLFDILAAVALVFFVVLPSIMSLDDVPGATPVFQNLLCERGETIDVHRQVYNPRPGSTTYSAEFFCVRESGVERDVSGKMILMGIVGFTLPFLIGLFCIISGSASLKKKRSDSTAALLQGFGISADRSSYDVRTTLSGLSSEQANMIESLRSLKASKGTVNPEDVKSVLEGFGFSTGGANTFQVMTSHMGGQDTPADRLKALKNAYDQGLITQDEYESKRKDILREM